MGSRCTESGYDFEVEPGKKILASVLIGNQVVRALQEAIIDRQWGDVRELVDIAQLLKLI